MPSDRTRGEAGGRVAGEGRDRPALLTGVVQGPSLRNTDCDVLTPFAGRPAEADQGRERRAREHRRGGGRRRSGCPGRKDGEGRDHAEGHDDASAVSCPSNLRCRRPGRHRRRPGHPSSRVAGIPLPEGVPPKNPPTHGPALRLGAPCARRPGEVWGAIHGEWNAVARNSLRVVTLRGCTPGCPDGGDSANG